MLHSHQRTPELLPGWDWFEDLEMVQEQEGTTLFSGPLRDQAALSGILMKIRGLGLTLLSLEMLESSQEEEPRRVSH